MCKTGPKAVHFLENYWITLRRCPISRSTSWDYQKLSPLKLPLLVHVIPFPKKKRKTLAWKWRGSVHVSGAHAKAGGREKSPRIEESLTWTVAMIYFLIPATTTLTSFSSTTTTTAVAVNVIILPKSHWINSRSYESKKTLSLSLWSSGRHARSGLVRCTNYARFTPT